MTPAIMQGLANAVSVRDGGCLWASSELVEVSHICGGPLEAHHICEQSWIKDEYLRRGGIYSDSQFYRRLGTPPNDRPSAGKPIYRPMTRFEFVDPVISATEIAADPRLCVCLCRRGHELFPGLPVTARLDIVDPQREDLVEAIVCYSMERIIERHDPMFWTGLLGRRTT